MKLGDWGEDQAAGYLEKKGYKLIERNFRCKTGEIDLIAWHVGVLCFFEVKTRKSLDFGQPSEAVTRVKQQHIRRTAQVYLLSKNWTDVETRIDVIEILKYGEKTYINHIENAVG